MNDAAPAQTQRDRLAELLVEMETEAGPIPDEVMEQARRAWRSSPTRRRR